MHLTRDAVQSLPMHAQVHLRPAWLLRPEKNTVLSFMDDFNAFFCSLLLASPSTFS
jgi:hypothetical protein